jgi:dimeric dUTPase (all-alpha-NTP-PPase superfamily)
MEKDMLRDMLQRQKNLQGKIGMTNYDQEYININALALISETMEALNETRWKPWKKQQGFSRELYTQELIDAFHFWMNMCIAVDMTADEIYEKYKEKNKENHDRQDRGY